MQSNSLDLIVRSLPLFLKGASVTLQVFFSASCFSILLGLFFGMFTSKRLSIPIFSKVLEVVTFITRAIPFFVQLLIVYFVLPDLFKFDIDPFSASVLSLGICSSGFVAQFFRGAIDTISTSQWEAAHALGYTKAQTLVYTILPQAFRIALPPMNNELDSLLKSTAIISSIGMMELTRVAMNIVSREMEPIPIYLAIAAIYVCMSATLNITTRTLERKFSYVKN